MKSERESAVRTGLCGFGFASPPLAILHCVLLNSREPASWERRDGKKRLDRSSQR